VVHRDHAANVGGKARQTLTHTHQLFLLVEVDAELAGAILAGDLADLGGDTEMAKCIDDDLTHLLEAGADLGTGLGTGDCKRESDGVLGEDGGASTGKSFHCRKAGSVCRLDRRWVLGGDRIAPSEGDLAPGRIQTQGGGHLAGGDLGEYQRAQGSIDAGIFRPGPTQQMKLGRHGQERSGRITGYRNAAIILPRAHVISVRTILKRIIVLVVFALVVAACSEDGLLSGLGDRSQQIVHGDASTTTTTVEPIRGDAPLGSVRASDVVWYNDGIPGEGKGVIGEVIAAVWGRGDGITSVIQASRNEIATVLPGIQFPELLPDSVSWVTSQLVFDVASGTIDTDTAAQFGMWSLEPYTSEDARSALMWVRPATSADVIGPIVPESTSEGLNLSWVAESYHYRILCPTTLLEDYCWQMAESAMPLSLLLPAE
jgi:hypothetical protein